MTQIGSGLPDKERLALVERARKDAVQSLAAGTVDKAPSSSAAEPSVVLTGGAELEQEGLSIGLHRVISGTLSGHLYVWFGRRLERSVVAHRDAVTCMSVGTKGVVTGGRDGIVKIWDYELHQLQELLLNQLSPPPLLPALRSVCWSPGCLKLLVVTAGSEILEYSADSGRAVTLVSGHCQGVPALLLIDFCDLGYIILHIV
jgi:WD40 repeat protein